MEVYTNGGWFIGAFPPGKARSPIVGHVFRNVLNAHVECYHALKAIAPNVKIGFVKNLYQLDPWNSWNPLDVFLSSKANGVFNDRVIEFFKTGTFRFDLPLPGLQKVESYNSRAVSSYDFCGLNYYSHSYVQVVPWNLANPIVPRHLPHAIMTDMTYPIYAEGFYRAIMQMSSALKKPIIITENGLADKYDDRRALFIRRYLFALSKAIRDGAQVLGYFYWSLYDNFEWCLGYDMRFGLYETNYATQQRTLRAGAKPLIDTIDKWRKKRGGSNQSIVLKD